MQPPDTFPGLYIHQNASVAGTRLQCIFWYI